MEAKQSWRILPCGGRSATSVPAALHVALPREIIIPEWPASVSLCCGRCAIGLFFEGILIASLVSSSTFVSVIGSGGSADGIDFHYSHTPTEAGHACWLKSTCSNSLISVRQVIHVGTSVRSFATRFGSPSPDTWSSSSPDLIRRSASIR